MSTRAFFECLFLALTALPAAYGQFDFYVLEGSQQRPAPAVYNLGSFYAGESVDALLYLRNSSTSPATLTVLNVAGFGFVLSPVSLPLTLAPQTGIEFSVAFRASETGAYSASLNANGVSILLTLLVQPRLTYAAEGAPNFPGPLDFGNVVPGKTVLKRIQFRNDSAQLLTVPLIAVEGPDFTLPGTPPSGQAIPPGQEGEFTIAFTPQLTGARAGSLTLGDRTYPLTGTGFQPSLPKPKLSIDLKQIASAQQGTLTVRFDAPAQIRGTGIATLDFQGSADPTIAFAAGGRRIIFPISEGETQASLPFQTGTTAGVLTFSVDLGDATDRQTITIGSAAPGISGVQAVRSGGVLELRITGFDNTRSLGALTFTFYDSAGNPIAPGVIRADASAEFSRYFAATDLGGVFLLRLAFPVNGDAAGIASCEATLTNSAGSSRVPRTAF